MRARLMVAIMLMVLAGCEEKIDPATSPLAEGSRAIAFDPKEQEIQGGVAPGHGLLGANFVYLAVGTPVLVMHDGEDPRNPRRNVRVNVQGGENRGMVVVVTRDHLRP